MPALSITRRVNNGTVFTATQNDQQLTDVETLLNTTKLDSTNIQNGGISTANLAAASVDSTKLAANAVKTAAIEDAAITAAKLNTAIVDDSTIAISDSQLIVKTGGITGTQIATNVNLAGIPQAAGKNLVASSSNATNKLVIIQGNVDISGNVVSGEGFTSSRISTGVYNVGFTNAFTVVPAANVTGVYNGSGGATGSVFVFSSGGISTTGFQCISVAGVNTAFSFIAIGQLA